MALRDLRRGGARPACASTGRRLACPPATAIPSAASPVCQAPLFPSASSAVRPRPGAPLEEILRGRADGAEGSPLCCSSRAGLARLFPGQATSNLPRKARRDQDVKERKGKTETLKLCELRIADCGLRIEEPGRRRAWKAKGVSLVVVDPGKSRLIQVHQGI